MITEKIILWDTNYGYTKCKLKEVMLKKKYTMYQVCRLTGLKYDVIKKYYYDTIIRYDSLVIAKLCYVLECSISDLLSYNEE